MQHYLVIGLGMTGLSMIEFLRKRSGVTVVAFDTRVDLDVHDLKGKFPDLTYYLGALPFEILDDIDVVLMSPGLSLDTPIVLEARRQGIPIHGDIELFYHYAQAPIIGITGTNAKSTVTTLVGQMINATGFRALVGGNIGVPALALLDLPVPDYYVLELSSFQLELLENFSCLVGVVLNISPDHLDRHGDIVNYQLAKERLYLNCQHPVYFRGIKYHSAPTQVSYTFDNDVPEEAHDFGVLEVNGQRYLARGAQRLLPVAHLGSGLHGEHNVLNALSALAVTAPLQLDLVPQLEVLKHFKGLPHRCALVRTVDGVHWIDDSKGTNTGATIAAIKGMALHAQGRIILVLGGVGKDQDFTLLREAVTVHIAHAIIFGQDKAMIAQALHEVSYEFADDLDDVIAKAHAFSKADDVVLFSPACASFDMFKNYSHRGDEFAARVMALPSRHQDL
jgi:UDP-N-acetylmuramoylalanine--D-glutamate ligase